MLLFDLPIRLTVIILNANAFVNVGSVQEGLPSYYYYYCDRWPCTERTIISTARAHHCHHCPLPISVAHMFAGP